MDAHRASAAIVGALFLVATGAGVLSVVLIDPVLDDPDYLTRVSANDGRVLLATLLDLTVAAAVVGIAVMLFPLLRRTGEGAALGYVGARIVEAAVIVVGGLSSLVLLRLSEDYAEAGTSGSQSSGEVLLAAREWSDVIGTRVVFGLGAVILYGLLYRSRLVPAFLSVWGLAGAVLITAGGVAVMFGLGATSATAIALTAPVAVNELALAVWLIVRGFSRSAPVSGPGPAEASEGA